MSRLFVEGPEEDAAGRAPPRVNDVPPASPSPPAGPLPPLSFASSRTALRVQQQRADEGTPDDQSAVADVEAALVARSRTPPHHSLFPTYTTSWTTQRLEYPLLSPLLTDPVSRLPPLLSSLSVPDCVAGDGTASHGPREFGCEGGRGANGLHRHRVRVQSG